MREDQFHQRLMATFKVEAEEYIREIINSIELLENQLEDRQEADSSLVEASYRQFHSLKGAAQAVGYDKVGQTCQKAESILAEWKSNIKATNLPDLQRIVELTISTANELHISYPGRNGEASEKEIAPAAGSTASAAPTQSPEPSPQASQDSAPAVTAEAKPAFSAAEAVAKATASAGIPSADSSADAQKEPNIAKVRLNSATAKDISKGSETIRISSLKLDSLLRRGEQLVLARINSMQRYNEAKNLLADLVEMRQNFAHIDSDTVSSEVSEHRFSESIYRFISNMHKLVRNLASDHHELDSQLAAMLEEVKRARLAPVRPLMEELEIAARRIARQLGKKVRVTIYGNELELDRSIMESLKDPLMHLVRNALDHGLESPEERLQSNKPLEGHLTIGIRTHGTSTMEFTVADDGRGIQTEEVIEAAKRQGLIADGVAIDSLDLIFSSGVSTRKQVSSISGRGLGMAIVRDKVEALKGSVRVKTRVGEGTTFELSMPTSFATFNGLLIREYGREMVIPLNGVDAVAQFRSTDIRTVEGSQVVNFRDTIIPLSRLGQMLGLSEAPGHIDSDPCQAIIVTAGGRKAAFLLDEINGVHEVLTRDLGPQLKKLRFII
ncbi:chemotaxis protein CheW, partial [bacterium]|nr:chemotaxis protein CheW [bacterium]